MLHARKTCESCNEEQAVAKVEDGTAAVLWLCLPCVKCEWLTTRANRARGEKSRTCDNVVPAVPIAANSKDKATRATAPATDPLLRSKDNATLVWRITAEALTLGRVLGES
jgi:hypothetical protein